MTAALRMKSPGELSAAELRLLEFAGTKQRSLKALRQHLSLTPQATNQMLTKLIEMELISYQANGMYRTRSRDMAAITAANDQSPAAQKQPKAEPASEEVATEQAKDAPADAEDEQPESIYDMRPLMSDEEIIDIDADEPVSIYFSQPVSDRSSATFEPRLAAVLAEIEQLQRITEPAIPPVQMVDDKIFALEQLRNNFLGPKGSAQLCLFIDEIIADLSEIQLYQKRKGV